MATQGSWDSVRQHGLLSTSALLDLFEVEGSARAALESQRRPKSVEINHPILGSATIRDQKPLNEKLLLKCLEGMGPSDWYRLLNEKVFFWADRERLDRFLCAGAYKQDSHDVLVVDTASLLSSHARRAALCRINSGATYFMAPALRGLDTFQRIGEYPARDAKSKTTIAEVAIDYSIPDIENHVVTRLQSQCGGPHEVVWSREDVR